MEVIPISDYTIIRTLNLSSICKEMRSRHINDFVILLLKLEHTYFMLLTCHNMLNSGDTNLLNII